MKQPRGAPSTAKEVFFICYDVTRQWEGSLTQRRLLKKVNEVFVKLKNEKDENRERFKALKKARPALQEEQFSNLLDFTPLTDTTLKVHIKAWLIWRRGDQDIIKFNNATTEKQRQAFRELPFFMRRARLINKEALDNIKRNNPSRVFVYWAADQARLTELVRNIPSLA